MKNYQEIIEKAKNVSVKLKQLEGNDSRVKNVLGFLAAKKLLLCDGIKPLPFVAMLTWLRQDSQNASIVVFIKVVSTFMKITIIPKTL